MGQSRLHKHVVADCMAMQSDQPQITPRVQAEGGFNKIGSNPPRRPRGYALRMLEKLQNTSLGLPGRGELEATAKRSLDPAGAPCVKYNWVDIGFTAHRRRVSQFGGDLPYDMADLDFEGALAGILGMRCS